MEVKQNQNQIVINLGNSLLEWDTPEFIKYHTGRAWKIAAIGVVLLLLGISALLQSLTFALVILAFAFTYYILFNRLPGILRIKLCEKGIQIGSSKIPYENIHGYWIIDNPPISETFSIRIKGKVLGDMTYLRINTKPDQIRQVLNGKIPEMPKQSESGLDIFLKLLRI